ncbi:TIGR03364 family FAD-dependent oxidoreductase [Dactylosporangium sp. CA-139066]|uniref:TIGR03364 family FAD-dependent oxidoreductase n=1 Tax=Dactylosporangium sp. CA-139066 TaxID=3239930 RepID=UPI003D8B3AF9
MRIVIVGGGVLGTMHAWHAVRRGHEVVHLEREAEARGASVRNFGLVWVSGRSPGPELATALRARRLWEQIGAEVPGVGFRGNGSMTLIRTAGEWAVAEAAVADPAVAAERGWRLLDAPAVRAVNPALRGDFLGGLHCAADGAVEPRVALPALRACLEPTGRYTWLPGREVRDAAPGAVRDDTGAVHAADQVVLATGAALGGLVRELAGPLPIRRVWLQMAQTAPLGEPLTTSVADADSFRYYPAYDSAPLAESQPQPPVAAEHKMQLLMVQRLDGGLTIGDTHAYAEPFPFDEVEPPYDHLTEVASSLLGRPLPRIERRWNGVYAQCLDPAAVAYRAIVAEGVCLVTGPGGRGMTCSPAIAERTAEELSW